jgi:hypothetical protein
MLRQATRVVRTYGSGSMLRTFRSQTILRDEIPPGTEYFPTGPPLSTHGIAQIQLPQSTSYQQRMNAVMAFNFLNSIPAAAD